MKKKCSFILFLVSLLPHSVMASEALSAMTLIQNMSDAMHHKSYSGDFVYLHSDQLESMSITHIRSATGVKERLYSLNGEAREVFRDDENLTCVWPGSKKIIKDEVKKSSFSPLWIPDDVKRLAKFYQFELVGADRVADRNASILKIKPKDGMRYGMQIWVDTAEGFLLKSLLMSSNGDVLEQVMFTKIESIAEEQISAMSLLATPAQSDFSLVQSHSNVSGTMIMPDKSWNIEVLPKGFWLESSYRKPSTKGQSVYHMVFTDGLASLSVFIEKQSTESLMGSSSMGAINAYGAIINGYSVTAVGEVPQATVKHLVSSIYHE